MDDKLDEDLKNHIKKVFDDYDDPTAGDGWLLLRKKYPQQQSNRRLLPWLWWSAAALLLLVIGLGLWKYNLNNHVEKLSVKPQKTILHRHRIPGIDSAAVANKIAPLISAKQKGKTSGYVKVKSITLLKTPVHITRNKLPEKLNLGNLAETTNKKLYAPGKSDTAVKIANSVIARKNDQLIVTVKPNNLVSSPDTAKPKQKAKSAANMFAGNNTNKQKTEPVDRRVRFGVYGGSYFNYAKGSGNQSNFGGGITSEIRINKNLKLVTGISVTQNSLNFGGGVPTGAAQSNFFTVPAAPGGTATSRLRAFSLNGANVVTSATAPAFKNYSTSLVGLDVPVNLKYEFNPQKNHIYVMAGLSSGTFINEAYTYQYNYPAILSPTLQQTQNETSRKNFNSFYFGKMLNVAFGVGYPIGRNHVVLEPFLKYPLDGIGSQNIKFGAGGINLKFTFPTFKK